MTEIPAGSVIVTPDDMWKAIEETRDAGRRTENAVNELKALVSPALADIREDITKVDARIDKTDARVTELEHQSWATRWVPALATSVVCTVVGGVALFLLTRSVG